MKTITQLFFLLACTFASFAQTKAYIDFGAPDNETAGNYNNVSTNVQNAPNLNIADLIDSDGLATGITLDVNIAFDGVNSNGTTDAGDAIPFPTAATSDSFFGAVNTFNSNPGRPAGEFTLSGLQQNMFYTFSIFASRTGVAGSKETLYTLSGATVETATLEVNGNRGNRVIIENMQADANGEISVNVTAGANNTSGNQFYYVGAVELIMSEQVLSIDSEVLNTSLAVYPNPVSNSAQIKFDLKEAANLKIAIYDLSGRLVENIVNAKQPAGTFSTTWNRSANIAAGVYILQIDADGKSYNSKLLLK
ncbi:T9SS type A sorting domain-containing protein [Flavimarina sp. Hel_I_48]|uniref:T9SS type A sorting domain-containing protein n=1 Tax=Flavimarina sp. Hel_I_48 TaxID=1392488 RepID=UPI0004DF5E7F|nr:T9SS type A sorting domain-containing protein [Flavimarina sp. Hel_I_48]